MGGILNYSLDNHLEKDDHGAGTPLKNAPLRTVYAESPKTDSTRMNFVA